MSLGALISGFYQSLAAANAGQAANFLSQVEFGDRMLEALVPAVKAFQIFEEESPHGVALPAEVRGPAIGKELEEILNGARLFSFKEEKELAQIRFADLVQQATPQKMRTAAWMLKHCSQGGIGTNLFSDQSGDLLREIRGALHFMEAPDWDPPLVSSVRGDRRSEYAKILREYARWRSVEDAAEAQAAEAKALALEDEILAEREQVSQETVDALSREGDRAENQPSGWDNGKVIARMVSSAGKTNPFSITHATLAVSRWDGIPEDRTLYFGVVRTSVEWVAERGTTEIFLSNEPVFAHGSGETMEAEGWLIRRGGVLEVVRGRRTSDDFLLPAGGEKDRETNVKQKLAHGLGLELDAVHFADPLRAEWMVLERAATEILPRRGVRRTKVPPKISNADLRLLDLPAIAERVELFRSFSGFVSYRDTAAAAAAGLLGALRFLMPEIDFRAPHDFFPMMLVEASPALPLAFGAFSQFQKMLERGKWVRRARELALQQARIAVSSSGIPEDRTSYFCLAKRRGGAMLRLSDSSEFPLVGLGEKLVAEGAIRRVEGAIEYRWMGDPLRKEYLEGVLKGVFSSEEGLDVREQTDTPTSFRGRKKLPLIGSD